MMKILLILLFCCTSLCVLLFAIQVPSEKYQNDLKAENLKGKVKFCAEFYYKKYNPGIDIDSGYEYMSKDSFDLNGKLLSSIISGDPTKKPIPKIHGFFLSYDKEGRKTVTRDQAGQIIGFSAYSVGKKNNLVEAYSNRPGNPVMLKIIYNSDGNRDTMYQYDIVGKFMGKVIYHYDKNQDLIEEDRDYINTQWSYKTILIYDKHHHNIETIRYDAKTPNGSRKNYGYDEFGNMTMERDTSTDIYIGGNRIFSVDPSDKNFIIFKCKYSNFDNNENWLREDMFHNDTIAKTFKRVIEYYQ